MRTLWVPVCGMRRGEQRAKCRQNSDITRELARPRDVRPVGRRFDLEHWATLCRLVYAHTLREWRRHFMDNFAKIEQALRKDHPGVFDSEQDERGAHELAVLRQKWARA
jgi:hypothetical protein